MDDALTCHKRKRKKNGPEWKIENNCTCTRNAIRCFVCFCQFILFAISIHRIGWHFFVPLFTIGIVHFQITITALPVQLVWVNTANGSKIAPWKQNYVQKRTRNQEKEKEMNCGNFLPSFSSGWSDDKIVRQKWNYRTTDLLCHNENKKRMTEKKKLHSSALACIWQIICANAMHECKKHQHWDDCVWNLWCDCYYNHRFSHFHPEKLAALHAFRKPTRAFCISLILFYSSNQKVNRKWGGLRSESIAIHKSVADWTHAAFLALHEICRFEWKINQNRNETHTHTVSVCNMKCQLHTETLFALLFHFLSFPIFRPFQFLFTFR